MKYSTTTFIAFFLFNVICNAQVFDVDTLRWSGDIEKKINLVILGDGYVENEINKFINDANSFSDEMFSQTPFKEYQNYFNIFIVKVISNESGVTHPGSASDVTEPQHPVSQVDNYFGSTFDAFDIHRLVVAENQSKINTVLARNFPLYDQVIILANSPYYGGSGGFFPVATTDASANEIAIHELGHSFANLADEYYAGDVFAGEYANMTKQTDSELVKWTNWYGDFGTGIYQHCCNGQSASWYRPHQNCKMRYLGAPFCAVCIERIIEVIHQLTSPLEGFLPGETVPASNFPLPLKLQLAHPLSNQIYTKWTLNGTTLARNKDSVFIELDDLEFGENEVNVLIEDRSDFLRVDYHTDIHFEMLTWFINNDMTSVNPDIKVEESCIEIYPNPTPGKFTVSGNLSLFKIEILYADGKNFQTINSTGNVHVLDLSTLPAGTFLIKILSKSNNLLEVRKIIKN